MKYVGKFFANSTLLPEAEALRLARKGVSAGFESLYRLHHAGVFRVCLQAAGSATEAENLTKQAFLELFRNIHTFRRKSQLIDWLYRTTAEIALGELRKRRHAATAGDEPSRFDAAFESVGNFSLARR